MALSKPFPMPIRTKEDTNFLRLADLIIRVSPRAVRILFDKHFNPGGLQTYLIQIKTKLEALQKKRVINQSQMDILYPKSGTTQVTSTDMDVPLMLVMFRNFTKLKLRDSLPPPTDTSESDDLSRIRHYRNLIAHSSDGKIDDVSFSTAWTDICEALQRLGGRIFKDEGDALLVAELDSTYRDVYLNFVQTERRLKEVETSIQKLQLEHKDVVPSNIRELMSDEINDWGIADKKFYVTSAATAITEIIKVNQFVVITGSPGIGKSATARHIALSLGRSDTFEILTVESPGKIIKYFKTNCSQIFLVDDICGKFCAEQNLVDKWGKSEDKLKGIFRRATSLRIIGTCRMQIFNDEKVQNLISKFGMKECNLTTEEFMLSIEEKREIAKCHCDENIVSQLSDEIVNQFDMFPLLCVTFSRSESNATLDLFKNPYRKFEDELLEMRQQNEDCFIGLVLLVIFNNKVKLDLFRDRRNKRLDKICDDIFEICKLRNRPIKHRVLPALRTLQGTYIHVLHSVVTAVHDKIFDIISYYIGSHFIDLILECGSSTFIYQRIQLESLNLEHDEYTIMVQSDFEGMYFQRIMEDVKQQKLDTVFNNNQVQDKTFQEIFLSSLSCCPDIQFVFLHNQWSLVFATFDDRKLIVDFMIDKLKQQREQECDEYSNKEYATGCDFSDTSDEEANQYIQYSKQKDSAFIYAALKLDTYIVEMFLENYDIDVDSVVSYGSDEGTALMAACNNGHTNTVSVLINKYNCNVNLKGNSKSPLHIACAREYPDIVDILLSANCDVNTRDADQKTPLFIACDKGNLEIVKKLLQKGCDTNLKCDEYSPLHVACRNQSVEIVEMLLSAKCDVNACDKYQKSPLLFACETGNPDIVLKLLEMNCDINVCDVNGSTPLAVVRATGCKEIEDLLQRFVSRKKNGNQNASAN